jgi:hypothetical protein
MLTRRDEQIDILGIIAAILASGLGFLLLRKEMQVSFAS